MLNINKIYPNLTNRAPYYLKLLFLFFVDSFFYFIFFIFINFLFKDFNFKILNFNFIINNYFIFIFSLYLSGLYSLVLRINRSGVFIKFLISYFIFVCLSSLFCFYSYKDINLFYINILFINNIFILISFYRFFIKRFSYSLKFKKNINCSIISSVNNFKLIYQNNYNILNIYNFYTYEKNYEGKVISQIKIQTIDNDLFKIKNFKKINLILIVKDDFISKKRTDFINFLDSFDIPYKFVDKNYSYSSMDPNIDISPEDIIPPKNLNFLDNISFYNNKNILITGAGGSIGKELSKNILKFSPSSLIILDSHEESIFNLENNLREINSKILIIPIIYDMSSTKYLKYIIDKWKVNVVFHAAAYKHVYLVEQNIYSAFYKNIVITLNLLKAIKNKPIFFNLISSDKSVNPSSVMGSSKFICELLTSIFNKNSNYKIIRFGNVIGSSGSLFPIIKGKLIKKDTIEVTHQNASRFFMNIIDACLLVILVGSLKNQNKSSNIYLLDMGKRLNIYELVKKMVKMAGLKINLTNNPNKFNEIRVKFIGLKIGEKLNEELFDSTGEYLVKHNEFQDILVIDKDVQIDIIDKYKKILNIIHNIKMNYNSNNQDLKFILNKFLKDLN